MPRLLHVTALRFVAALLAALIPLQGLAAAVLVAQGPLHVHRSTSSRVVFDDLRRSVPVRALLHGAPAVSADGHVHGVGQRHHHARGDASVERMERRLDGAWAGAGADDELGSATPGAAFLAVLPGDAGPLVTTAGHAAASRAGWPLLTHDPRPFERPPRAA